MKKVLLTLVLAAGMISMTNAQTKDFCFQDIFGYSASVTATRIGLGYWSLSGTGDIGDVVDWTMSGYMDKGLDNFSMTWTNPNGPCDDIYVDDFTYVETSHGGGTINFNWNSNYCGGPWSTGTGSTDFSLGLCAFRMADGTPSGPGLASLEPIVPSFEIYADPSEPTFPEMLPEPVFNVVRNDEATFTFGFELDADAAVTIDIYNHVGQYIATIVSGNETKGYHTATWNSADAISGMYVAVMNTNGVSITNKFVK